MSAPGIRPSRASDVRSPRSRTAGMLLAGLFFAAATIGVVGTWAFNLSFVPSPEAPSYLEGWFANPAASSLAVDVIVVAVAACVFYVVEAVRLRQRWLVFVAVLLMPLTFAVALAFTFPLFLGLREVVLLSSRGPSDLPAPL